MTDFTVIQIDKVLYWARMVPRCDMFEVTPLKVQSIADTYFICTTQHGHQSYLFKFTEHDTQYLFEDPKEAEELLLAARAEYIANKPKPVKGSISYALSGIKDTDSE